MPGVIASAAVTFLSSTALVTTVGIGGLITIGSVIGGLAVTGASLALQSALAPKAPGIGGINSPAVKGSLRQATPSQRVIYGTQRVGGAVFFLDDSQPPYLYLGLLLSVGRVSAVKATYVGVNQVTFDSNGEALSAPYRSGATVRLYRSFRDGAPDQAIDPILTADFANLDAEFRQRGIATVVFKFDYGTDIDNFEELWGRVQIPNVSLLVDGVAIYDPRDPTQDMDDETTWTFSNNAALVQADWLRKPYGGRIATTRIYWDRVAEAADYDDELVGLKGGGFQKRHTIDGVVALDQSPGRVFEAMLGANRGFVVQHAGKVWVTSSKPRAVVRTIHDGSWVSGFTYRNEAPKSELINTMRVRFVAPERDYEVVDGPVLANASYETADAELLEGTADLVLTRTHQRAQRLARGLMEQSRLGRTLSGSVGLEFLGIKAGDVLYVESAIYPAIDGTYMVADFGFADDFSALALTLAEYDPDINADWDPDTDEQDFTLPELDVS